MWRHLGFMALILVLSRTAAQAGMIPPPSLSLRDVPATYVPGTTISFDVDLSDALSLAAYNVGLTLTSTAGVAGSDLAFLSSPASNRPVDGLDRYVFDSGLAVSPIGFVATPDVNPALNAVYLSLSDFLATGQSVLDVSPATKVATVLIATTPASGDLALGFDTAVLELLDPTGQPVIGFGTLLSKLGSSAPTIIRAQVPEPAALSLFGALLLIGSSYISAKRRFRSVI